MDTYAFVKRMSNSMFEEMIVGMIVSAADNFDPVDPEDMPSVEAFEWAMETVSHQVAVMFAQRYDCSVPTEEPLSFIDFAACPDAIKRNVARYMNFHYFGV